MSSYIRVIRAPGKQSRQHIACLVEQEQGAGCILAQDLLTVACFRFLRDRTVALQ
jgi:hypothetical protein